MNILADLVCFDMISSVKDFHRNSALTAALRAAWGGLVSTLISRNSALTWGVVSTPISRNLVLTAALRAAGGSFQYNFLRNSFLTAALRAPWGSFNSNLFRHSALTAALRAAGGVCLGEFKLRFS